MISGRLLAADLIIKPGCFEDIIRVCRANLETLLDLDRSFKIEWAILQSAQETIDATLQDQSLMCLPDERHAITLSQSYAKLIAIEASDLFNMAGAVVQRSVQAVVEVVANMREAIFLTSNSPLGESTLRPHCIACLFLFASQRPRMSPRPLAPRHCAICFARWIAR